MKQLTLATTGFERYAKTTRRAAFLAEMDRVVPWSALCGLIEPIYPKPGNGRPPVGAERMLRIYFLQQWFNLSDPAVEEALYDSHAMRLRRDRPRPRAGARRDHRVPLPPSARNARE
jgi:IS5 family transposase